MMTAREIWLRERVGVPLQAERTLIFAESSHWDPDWLLTSDEYYRLRIRRILGRALRELTKDPRRVYSLECVFFLKMYWDRHPEKQDLIRELVNSGRLRLTGSGITTPDTLLPSTEAILRDYFMGQDWLRKNGLTQEPRLAYLPDDFGHSPALPSILQALGLDYAAISRLDGAFFPGADYESAKNFPRPGSSAALLLRDFKTCDFFWRGPDGATVLTHWNPFTYGQGDMIAAAGLVRWMGLTLGRVRRDPRHVARRIDSYVKQLAPLAKTPYLFCPIGFDFVDPIPDLNALLDQYNQTRGQETGVFAVLAGMDDYLDLVKGHGEKLPTLELEMNPYWMGFYSARPEMKQRCRKLALDLVAAEKLLIQAQENEPKIKELWKELESAWETLAVSNHHDFITGTSPNRVWKREQKPWLEQAQIKADRVIKLSSRNSRRDIPVAQAGPTGMSGLPAGGELPYWHLAHGRLEVETPDYFIELDEREGGGITRWFDPVTGENRLAGLGNDLALYEDSGGLWRMGHEYRGGVFRELDRASRRRASIQAKEREGALEAEVVCWLGKRQLTRRLWFRSDSPMVRMQVQGAAASHRTLTCRFLTPIQTHSLVMEVPGGVVTRPLVKNFNPTFWPAQDFVHFRDSACGQGLALFPGGPASVSANHQGGIELIALRNAPKERAFGFLPLLAHPASGPDPGEHRFDYALRFTGEGDWRENKLHLFDLSGGDTPVAPVAADNDDVKIIAVKKSARAPGLIVRLINYGPVGQTVKLQYQGRAIHRAFLCDAREREICELEIEEGRAIVPLTGAIGTIRLIFV